MSNPYTIAYKWVTEFQHRLWTNHEGASLAAAKSLLKDYELEDIIGCLDAVRDGVIELPYPLESLFGLRKFSPPIMDRWFQYKDFPPPIYLTTQYQEWQRRTGKGNKPVEDTQIQPLLLNF